MKLVESHGLESDSQEDFIQILCDIREVFVSN